LPVYHEKEPSGLLSFLAFFSWRFREAVDGLLRSNATSLLVFPQPLVDHRTAIAKNLVAKDYLFALHGITIPTF
jgi:hypothetical protein